MSAIGNSIADRRLQSYGRSIQGWVAQLRGDSDDALGFHREAVTLAPDPMARAAVLQFAGEAQAAAGDLTRARADLEQSLDLLSRMSFPQLDCWALGRLTEVELADGHTARARELASRALGLGPKFRYGAGLAERMLGRVALAERDLPRASAHLEAALRIFRELEAAYEIARTLLEVGILVRTAGDDGAAAHFSEARGLFATLGVPAWSERAARLAGDPGPAAP